MAILATRRRWEVTSLWAARSSPCSFQLLASWSSSSGVSIGNLRISCRYRERLPSGAIGRTDSEAIGNIFLLAGLDHPVTAGSLSGSGVCRQNAGRAHLSDSAPVTTERAYLQTGLSGTRLVLR